MFIYLCDNIYNRFVQVFYLAFMNTILKHSQCTYEYVPLKKIYSSISIPNKKVNLKYTILSFKKIAIGKV